MVSNLVCMEYKVYVRAYDGIVRMDWGWGACNIHHELIWVFQEATKYKNLKVSMLLIQK